MQAEKKFEQSQTPYIKWNFTYNIISKIDGAEKKFEHSQTPYFKWKFTYYIIYEIL